jgi:protoheme IX farnesyltransferase
MASLARTNQSTNQLTTRFRLYWPLIKSLQTGLLLVTGLAGFMSTRCPFSNWQTVLALTGSLFLAVSGSTVLNMWYDRDIDAKMERTKKRPIPSGQVSADEALRLGLILSLLGVGWAVALDALYGLIVFAGLFFDVVVYTIWLKRRTPWGIVWGGISGGMPALAGRALGTGQIEWVGIALSLAVLFWIPTHIMTFSIRYHDDYQLAGVPTFPAAYGYQITYAIIAISSVLAALMMALAAYGIGLTIGYLRLIVVLSVGLLLLAVRSSVRPSERINFALFKYASFYMLSAMLLLMFV